MAKITINDLLEAGCHFGHQTRRWNPKMKEFVYGAKNGISIIDLTKTMHQIADACNFLQNVVSKGGEVLFVGTKRQARDIVKAAAEKTGMFSVSERWLGGTLTNNVTIRKSIVKMGEIDKTLADEESAKSMKKKELSMLSRNAEKLHRDLDGIADMKKLPAVLVIVDVCNELNAVREANKLNIPIVAMVDTNGDPSLIQYPVAANDDAVKSIEIILNLFSDAIVVANEIYHKRVVEEKNAKGIEEKKAAEAAEAEAPRKTVRKSPRKEKEAAPADEAKLEDLKKAVEGEKKPAAKKPAAKKSATKKAEGAAAEKKPAAKKPAAKKAADKAE